MLVPHPHGINEVGPSLALQHLGHGGYIENDCYDPAITAVALVPGEKGLREVHPEQPGTRVASGAVTDRISGRHRLFLEL